MLAGAECEPHMQPEHGGAAFGQLVGRNDRQPRPDCVGVDRIHRAGNDCLVVDLFERHFAVAGRIE